MKNAVARVFDICDQAVASTGFELLDVEYQREPVGFVLRVFIDKRLDDTAAQPEEVLPPKASGGVGLAECALVSRHLSTVLDVEDVISERYHLEVSSPGVERPLRKPTHFSRCIGKEVRITLSQLLEGRRNYTGVVASVEAQEYVELAVDGVAVRLPFALIRKARLAESRTQR